MNLNNYHDVDSYLNASTQLLFLKRTYPTYYKQKLIRCLNAGVQSDRGIVCLLNLDAENIHLITAKPYGMDMNLQKTKGCVVGEPRRGRP